MEFPRIKLSQYFPKLFTSFGGNINAKVDLSKYAPKTDVKNVTQVDTSNFALKTNLANSINLIQFNYSINLIS